MYFFDKMMVRNELAKDIKIFNNLPYFLWKQAIDDPMMFNFLEAFEHEWKPAEIVDTHNKIKVDKKLRNHNVSLIECNLVNEGLFHAVHKIVESVNYYHYNYRLWSMDDIEVSRFTEGSLYVTHNDRIVLEDQSERKLSVMMGLSFEEQYEGGEVNFYPSGNAKFKHSVRLNRGDMIVYPSWLPYEIKPVTKGTLDLLGTCVYGPKFV